MILFWKKKLASVLPPLENEMSTTRRVCTLVEIILIAVVFVIIASIGVIRFKNTNHRNEMKRILLETKATEDSAF